MILNLIKNPYLFIKCFAQLSINEKLHATTNWCVLSSTAPQVDETRVRMFLEQGGLTEAERTARSAVRVPERAATLFY